MVIQMMNALWNYIENIEMSLQVIGTESSEGDCNKTEKQTKSSARNSTIQTVCRELFVALLGTILLEMSVMRYEYRICTPSKDKNP